jgi:hypothetical protein
MANRKPNEQVSWNELQERLEEVVPNGVRNSSAPKGFISIHRHLIHQRLRHLNLWEKYMEDVGGQYGGHFKQTTWQNLRSDGLIDAFHAVSEFLKTRSHRRRLMCRWFMTDAWVGCS